MKRARKELLTPRLSATLNKYQISKRNVFHIIKAQNLNGKSYATDINNKCRRRWCRNSLEEIVIKKRKRVSILIKFWWKNIQKNHLLKSRINTLNKFYISNFLYLHLSEWINSNEYNQGQHIIGTLKVVNDSAERGIKPI